MATKETQRYEVLAWLDDAADEMTPGQIEEFHRAWDAIGERHPDPDDRTERDAALEVAHRVITGDDSAVSEYADRLMRARLEQGAALAALQQAAVMLVVPGGDSESGFAARVGVDRMTVRKWLGKR